MGLINYMQSRQYKKSILSMTDVLSQAPDQELAGYLCLLYETRNTILFPDKLYRNRLISMGVEEGDIDRASVRIYHHESGMEEPLLKLIDQASHPCYKMMYKIYFFSNLPMTLDSLLIPIRSLWDVLMRGSLHVRSMYEDGIFDDNFLECKDVPLEDFLVNPRLILPHYMLVDSPAKKEIEDRKRVGRLLNIKAQTLGVR